MNKVILLVAFAALFGLGSALRCYECSDIAPGYASCNKFKAEPQFVQNCTEDRIACGKVVARIDGSKEKWYHRGCVTSSDPESCRFNEYGYKISCHFCKTDLCNTAAIPSTVSSLVYILPIALFLITGSSK